MSATHVRNVDFAFGLNRAFTDNQVTGSFAALAATITKPACGPTLGHYDISLQNAVNPRYLFFMVIGKAAADQTMNVRIAGRRLLGDVWIPFTLCEVVATLSTFAGPAAGTTASVFLSPTELVADTLVLTTGNANVDVTLISPADNTPAHGLIDLKGSKILTFQIDRVDATEGNVLWAVL